MPFATQIHYHFPILIHLMKYLKLKSRSTATFSAPCFGAWVLKNSVEYVKSIVSKLVSAFVNLKCEVSWRSNNNNSATRNNVSGDHIVFDFLFACPQFTYKCCKEFSLGRSSACQIYRRSVILKLNISTKKKFVNDSTRSNEPNETRWKMRQKNK